MIFADAADYGNWTGLGIGGLVVGLVFRTLWKQEGGWRSVLTASRDDAATARTDAATARTDAATARTDASTARADAQAARADAATARAAEYKCIERLTALDLKVAAIATTASDNKDRLDVIDSMPPVVGE